MQNVTVSVSDETARFLSVLGNPTDVLHALAVSAAEGLRRPGSWERQWISQLFSASEFVEKLEPDPEVGWRERPVA